jgi:hypothetical protein
MSGFSGANTWSTVQCLSSSSADIAWTFRRWLPFSYDFRGGNHRFQPNHPHQGIAQSFKEVDKNDNTQNGGSWGPHLYKTCSTICTLLHKKPTWQPEIYQLQPVPKLPLQIIHLLHTLQWE